MSTITEQRRTQAAAGRAEGWETAQMAPSKQDVREPNVSRYYDRHILKRPVWTWEIPAYLFVGGAAGASGVLAGFARATGNDRLARSATLAAAGCAALAPPLLIDDLGVKHRFYNMLRVFRPTSPMNLGTWILSAFGACAGTAAASEVTGIARPLGRAAEVGAAVVGPALSTYTAALVAQTSVPAWQRARAILPFVFAASSAACAGALACIATPVRHAAPARRLAAGGALVELAAMKAIERGLGADGAAYREEDASPYSMAATGLLAAGAATVALAGRTRLGAAAGGAMVLGGALATRFAVWKAGDVSVRRT